MTSFWGYVTEGCVLLVLAQWWMINTCVDIITSKQKRRDVKPRMTHPWPSSNIPVEILYKFFVSAVGVFGQLAYSGGRFHDEKGDFANMPQLMYMSIYGTFLLHALLDLLLRLRLPLVRGSNYATAAMGFGWYAVALYFRAQDLEGAGVAQMTLTFPVFILLPICLSLVLEPLWGRGLATQVVRAGCLQTFATWCFQSAHMLHVPTSFPGSGPNPSWDQADHRNVAFTAAFFGLHLCINLVLTAATYTITAYIMRMRFDVQVDNSEDLTSGYGYTSVATQEDVKESCETHSTVMLLSAYSS